MFWTKRCIIFLKGTFFFFYLTMRDSAASKHMTDKMNEWIKKGMGGEEGGEEEVGGGGVGRLLRKQKPNGAGDMRLIRKWQRSDTGRRQKTDDPPRPQYADEHHPSLASPLSRSAPLQPALPGSRRGPRARFFESALRGPNFCFIYSSQRQAASCTDKNIWFRRATQHLPSPSSSSSASAASSPTSSPL